jgi:ferredoxin
VDFTGCDGRGMCAEILPDLIRLDDWGYPIIADREVPRELLQEAAEAVRICPMLALHLDHARTGD